jgi:hypothetical protein
MTYNWWDIAALTVIGLGSAALILRHLLRLFAPSSGGGCCGCSKGCGADRAAEPPETPPDSSAKPGAPC